MRWISLLPGYSRPRPAGRMPSVRYCQTKTIGSLKTAARPASGSKLTPLGEGGGAIELEILAAIKVALLVEMVVNRSGNGGEFL